MIEARCSLIRFDEVRLFADYGKGPALHMKALQGITATNLDEKQIYIPPANVEWIQRDYGGVPQSTRVGECMLIKLIENHVAVDFLILDGTGRPFNREISRSTHS